MVMYDWEKTRRSKYFRFKADLTNMWDLDAIAKVREDVRKHNKQRHRTGLPHMRVWLAPRLGKNNPNAWKYKECPRKYQMIHMDDARYVDVYVRERKDYAD